jgi:thiamine-monophosphate kinase
MKLSTIGEFGLIRCIANLCHADANNVILGIGDDCAAIQNNRQYWLVTTDLLTEGIHFDLRFITFYQLGYKSLAVNISDILAMGGEPEFFLTSLAAPSDIMAEDIEALYSGIRDLAVQFNISLIGGDTTAAQNHCLTISGTLIGKSDAIIRRKGASVGDKIYIAGYPGQSSAGLAILQKLQKPIDLDNLAVSDPSLVPFAPLLRRHLTPTPKALRTNAAITAMIDVSDGLLQDLNHICEQSQVGFAVPTDKIPISQSLLEASVWLNKDPLEFALRGGEDYELLFTSPDDLTSAYFHIGDIIAHDRIIIDSQGVERHYQNNGGYDHFKTNSTS